MVGIPLRHSYLKELPPSSWRLGLLKLFQLEAALTCEYVNGSVLGWLLAEQETLLKNNVWPQVSQWDWLRLSWGSI